MKKIGTKTIKPARRLNLSHDTQSWERLEMAIAQIYSKTVSQLSFEELHRHAYNLVLQKQGQVLYQKLKACLTHHLEHLKAVNIAPTIESTLGTFQQEGLIKRAMDSSLATTLALSQAHSFLKAIDETWKHHSTVMKMVSDIHLYLDRVYLKSHNPPLPSTFDTGMDLFRDVILEAPEIKNRLVETVCRMVYIERMGDQINVTLVRGLTDMMCKLEVKTLDSVPASSWFHSVIEPIHLDATRQFYSRLAQDAIASQDCLEYVKLAERRLMEEEDRCIKYLGDGSTGEKTKRLVQECLLTNHLQTFFNMQTNNVTHQLQHDMYDDLSRLYRVLEPVPEGHITLSRHAKTYARLCIEDLNQFLGGISEAGLPAQDAIKWVQSIMDLSKKFSMLTQRGFMNNKMIGNEIDSSFQMALNAHPRAPEYLALYVDDCLRRTFKDMSDHDIDLVLDRIVALFRFLRDRDVFERHYKLQLAKRLLTSKSLNEDWEKSLVSKLKVESGYQFTTKLEGMFKDIRLSQEITADFRHRFAHDLQPDFSINILMAGYWPLSNEDELQYPDQVQVLMKRFQDYYSAKYVGRKLKWLPSFGGADLRAQFTSGRKEINVSQLAMIVLLRSFNDDADWKSYGQILDETGLSRADLRRTLQSLSLGKFKILAKSTPKQKHVADDDLFRVNESFVTPMTRFKIPMIAATEDDEQRQDTMLKIAQQRSPTIDAAIVRIMKMRKRMPHNDLITETVRQLSSRFVPDVSMIKKQIESLIDREYLERGTENMPMYNYKA
jgi:cullin 3